MTHAQRWQGVLARLAGADVEQMRVLAEAFATDRRRRRQLAASEGGIPPEALALLLGMYLFIIGLGMAALAYKLAAVPGVAAVVVMATSALLLVAIALPEIFFTLLGDEDFRVIASWPVTSSSYLVARLRWLVGRAVAVTLLVCGPSALVMMAVSGIPIATGTVFLLYAVAASVGLAWGMTGLLSLGIAAFGARVVRGAGLALQVGAVVAPVAVGALVGRRTEEVLAYLLAFPIWLPLSWCAGLVDLAAGKVDGDTLIRAALAIVSLIALPAPLFRAGARTYTSSLWSARVHGRNRAGGRVLSAAGRLVRRALRRPEDAAVWQLLLAHVRADWRFRSRALAVPALSGGLIAGAVFGLPATDWFADPFGDKPLFHPAMLFVVLALTPPVLAVAALARSSDWRAAWLMRASCVEQEGFAQAGARLVRGAFVAPYVVTVGVAYLAAGAPVASVGAHLVTMALLAELTLLATQRLLFGLPFSRADDDDAVDRMIAVSFMLAYVLAGLLAFAVVHVLYRWWPAWLVGTGFMATGALSRRRGAAPAPLSAPSPEVAP